MESAGVPRTYAGVKRRYEELIAEGQTPDSGAGRSVSTAW